MKSLPALLGLLVALAFSGCVSPLASADRARMKRVGVVSILGDKVTANYVSIIAFTNQHYEEPAPELGMDALVERETARLLGTAGVPLPGERRVAVSTNFLVRDAKVEPAAVMALAQKEKLDGLLVVFPRSYRDHPHFHEGVTLTGHVYSKDEVHAKVLAGMYLFDGRDGRKLTSGDVYARSGQTVSSVALPDGTPVVWKKTYAAYTPAERAALREAVHAYVRVGLEEGLRQIGLLGP